MAGLVFVNPGSGPDETSVEELQKLLPGDVVEECDPDTLDDRLQQAIADNVSFIGIAGGDGTMRSAAQQLAQTNVPLLAIPAGTRNHFARDVGTPTIDDAVRAATGQIKKVDIGRVNGKYFVNNSSIGLYPKIVVRREAHERHLPKGIANIVAAWDQLRHGRRITVEIDGEPYLSWIVFVGNGVYGDGLLDLSDRESLDGNVLDVRVVRADRPMARMRVVGAVVLVRLARSPLIVRRHCRACTINVPQPKIEVALDGEVETMSTPLRYESIPLGLQVLVPSGAD